MTEWTDYFKKIENMARVALSSLRLLNLRRSEEKASQSDGHVIELFGRNSGNDGREAPEKSIDYLQKSTRPDDHHLI